MNELITHLCRVSEQSWSPSLGQTASAFLSNADLESVETVEKGKVKARAGLVTQVYSHILVFSLVDLESALHEIQWNDEGVRGSARQDSTEAA